MVKRFMEDSEDYTGRYRISGHTVEFVTIAYCHTHRYSFAIDKNEYITDSFEEFIDIDEQRKNKFLNKKDTLELIKKTMDVIMTK